jgi:translation initiation factor 1 (eIF-1/SUI1)
VVAEDERLRDGLRHNPFAKHWGKKPEETTPVPASTPPTSKSVGREKSLPAPRAGSASPPSPARVIVRRERKGHGGKAVTIAEGPGLADHDVETLARGAAKALGVGARVEEGALVVQGEQTERLITWLGTRGFTSVVRGN